MPYEKIKIDNKTYKIRFKNKEIKTNLRLLYNIANRLVRGYSVSIVICGSQRAGKSFIGLWIMKKVLDIFDKEIDYKKNIYYDPLEVLKNLKDMQDDCLMIDEASDVLDSREWYLKSHQAIKSIINVQGYKRNVFIFISPFIVDVDKTFRKHFNFVIRVDHRGSFTVFMLKQKWDEFNENKAVYKVFIDRVRIRMSDIPKEAWKEYSIFSQKRKEELRVEREMRLSKDQNIIDDPILRLKKSV